MACSCHCDSVGTATQGNFSFTAWTKCSRIIPMRVLITGATGFVGRHLIALLRSRGHSVYGTSFLKGRAERVPGAHIFRCDVRNAARLTALVRRIRPQRVFHLAASLR